MTFLLAPLPPTFPHSPLFPPVCWGDGGDVSSFFSYLSALGQIEKLLPVKLSVTKTYPQSFSKLNKIETVQG